MDLAFPISVATLGGLGVTALVSNNRMFLKSRSSQTEEQWHDTDLPSKTYQKW